MPRCSALKADSRPCERIVRPSQIYCSSHDPDRSDERSRNAAHAAKSKQNGEIGKIKRSLDELRVGVLSEAIDPKVATVANQISNSQLRALELERKIREADEFEARLVELEAIVTRQRTYRT